jgi:hypothetical protein
MPVEAVPVGRGLLRLADGKEQSQISGAWYLAGPATRLRTLLSTSRLATSPFMGTAFLNPVFPGPGFLSLGSLCRRHGVRLPDQTLQLVIVHGIEPIQHHPLVASDIRRWTNVLPLDQFGKRLWGALEAQAWIVQANNRENLPACLEAEIVAPLQVLGRAGEGKAKLTNRFHLHCVSVLCGDWQVTMPPNECQQKDT